MKAKDVMSAPVHWVAPDASVEQIAALLVERSISAVPVVDASGAVVGIVSEGDLMRRPESGTLRRPSWWLTLFADRSTLADEYVKSHGRHAADVMSRDTITVNADTPVEEIANLLERHAIKRVPVLRDGRLVGIVSRADLLRALANRLRVPAPSLSDGQIYERLMAGLPKQPWSGTAFLNIEVKDGTVEFHGLVSHPAEQRALRVFAENVPGVRAVKDDTAVRRFSGDA